jgi:hypothetical protein
MVNEELQVTDEYSEVIYNGKKIKIYNSFKGERLPEETYEEYKVRRKAVKNYQKSKSKGAMKYVSSMLIPQMKLDYNSQTSKFEETVSTDEKGNVIYTGKTKGKTYYKDSKEEDHMSLVNHLKEIANNEQGH